VSHAAATGLRVSDESPRGSIALELIRELGEELIERYGKEGSGPFEPGQVEREGGFFVVAWFGDQPVGCGALRPMTPEIGEVKRMFMRRAYRGRGLYAEDPSSVCYSKEFTR